jgi:hypothetical protein
MISQVDLIPLSARYYGSRNGNLSAGNGHCFAALQAWFLLPLRNLQSWQEAWFRLLPR